MLKLIDRTGDFFSYRDGSGEFRYVGMSDFGQWKRWNLGNGPEALVRPIWKERRTIADSAGYLGPIVARVFRYAHPGNAFGTPPGTTDYSQVNRFMDMAAEYSIYIDWTCGDSQYFLDTQGCQADLDLFTSNVARPCFVETCNEPFKNGDLPRNGVVPDASPFYLRDSGDYSEIQGWNHDTILDYVSYHGTRAAHPGPRFPKWIMDLNDQLGTLRSELGRPAVLKEPNGFDKTDRPGSRYNDPYFAFLLGQTVAYGGVTFHSTLGLESNGFDDQTKQAATFFFRGVKGGIV